MEDRFFGLVQTSIPSPVGELLTRRRPFELVSLSRQTAADSHFPSFVRRFPGQVNHEIVELRLGSC